MKITTSDKTKRGSEALMAFKKMWRAVLRRQRERIRKAGKHRCVKKLTGSANRVTGRNGKILKRPVVLHRFYECAKCGRDMK